MKTERLKKNVLVVLAILIVSMFAVTLICTKSQLIAVSAQEEIMPLSSPDRNKNLIAIEGKNPDGEITATLNDFTDTILIANSNYFITNPLHFESYYSYNSKGDCTTIAVQLLFGYHNYYSDRRLLPVSGNGKTFLLSDYGDISGHPILQSIIASRQGSSKTGTADGVHDEIFDLTFWAELPGLGQSVNGVTAGANKFLDKYTPTEIRDNITLKSEFFDEKDAKADIDAGLPIILGTQPIFNTNDSFHVIVAYGYGKLDGNDGYFVHYGWGDDITMGWIPKSWVMFQIRMSVEHTHNMIDTGKNYLDTYREIECSACGY